MSFPPPSPKQARLLWWSLTALAVGVMLALLGVLLWGLARLIGLLSPVLWPLAIAGVLAYVLDPLVDFLVSKNSGGPAPSSWFFPPGCCWRPDCWPAWCRSW